jgi:(2Fe-2S) ferredoxin
MATTTVPFHVVGTCTGFVLKDGYLPKYLKIKVASLEYWLKIPKSMRESFLHDGAIAVGQSLEVWGTEERKSYKLKLTLTEVAVIGQVPSPTLVPEVEGSRMASKPASKGSKQRILVCQKSNCWKRGGKQLCEAIQSEIGDRGLSVQVQLTGCLKDCKKAPNLVVMPDKSRYHHLTPSAIPALVERHFVEG